MSGAPEAPYFAIYGEYAGAFPRFYPREECPWLDLVERHWKEIRAEFEAFLRSGGSLGENFDPYGFGLTGWKSINFVTYLRRYHANCRRFPQTVELLESIPGLTSAFINKLEPHSAVSAHSGDSNTVYRCHLGLVVPAGAPDCGLEIESEQRGWREGEAFAFCDARRHRAWNETDRERVVLVFDVMRPEYREQTLLRCAEVLAAIALTLMRTRVPGARRLPASALRGLQRVLAAGFRLYLPLQRRLGGARL